jgi:hypothetical protein
MSYYRIDGKYINTEPKIIYTNKRTSNKKEKLKKIEKFSTPSIPNETEKERYRRKAKEYAKKQKAAKEYAEKHAEIKQIKKCFTMEIDAKPKPTPKPKPTRKPISKKEMKKRMEKVYSIPSVTKFIEENKNIKFFDKKKNVVNLNITKNNEICLTKLDRTVCVAANRFRIDAPAVRVADIERGDVIVPYRKKPSPPIYIKPKPKPAVPFRNPNKPLSVFMKKYGSVSY